MPGHHEACGWEEREGPQSRESVDRSVGRMDLGRTDRIAEPGVGYEDSGYQQRTSEETKKQRCSSRRPASCQRRAKSDRKGEDKRSAHQKVGDLHPPAVAGGELADVIPPCAISRPREAFDQKDDDE